METLLALPAIVGANVANVVLTAAGYSMPTGALGATIAVGSYAVGYGVTAYGISIGLAALARPDVPDPVSAATPFKQANPPRQRGYGETRLSGPLMLAEAHQGASHRIYALHEGKIDEITGYWLHDLPITTTVPGYVPVQDGWGGTSLLYIGERLGLPTETSYADDGILYFTTLPVGRWTTDHRGDGVASLYVQAQAAPPEDHLHVYPLGIPSVSVTAKLSAVFDPREGGHDIDDPDTWEWTDNAALCIADFVTHESGLALDSARLDLTALEQAADDCDEAVDTASSTEARYRAAGIYRYDNAPADVLAGLLASCDGWMAHRGDGGIEIGVGVYRTPDVTFTDAHICALEVVRGTPDEQAVDVLDVQFASPDHKYNLVATAPWRDEDAITAMGVERSSPLILNWVPSNGQASRLAKREIMRRQAPLSGRITTNLYGLKGLSSRWIAVESSLDPALADAVIQITGPAEVDLMSLRVSFPFILIDPETIDDYDAETEERPVIEA